MTTMGMTMLTCGAVAGRSCSVNWHDSSHGGKPSKEPKRCDVAFVDIGYILEQESSHAMLCPSLLPSLSSQALRKTAFHAEKREVPVGEDRPHSVYSIQFSFFFSISHLLSSHSNTPAITPIAHPPSYSPMGGRACMRANTSSISLA